MKLQKKKKNRIDGSYPSVQALLNDLDARDNGDYYVVTCPKCGHHEAYVFRDDLKRGHDIPVRCNRMKNCGKTTWFNIDNNVKSDEVFIAPKPPHSILKVNEEGLVSLKALILYVDKSGKRPENWRGISKKTLEDNHIVFYEHTLQFFCSRKNESNNSLFDDTLCTDTYARDIFIPIYSEDGDIDRVLLRSSKPIVSNSKHKKPLKEITLRLKVRGQLIWNVKDMYGKSPFLFITEGVPDALSIKEVCPSADVIALPGVRNYKRILKEMEKHPESRKKAFVPCFDNDEAGKKCIHDFSKELKRRKVEVRFFNLCGYKDMNEFLLGNRNQFSQEIRKIMKKEGD